MFREISVASKLLHLKLMRKKPRHVWRSEIKMISDLLPPLPFPVPGEEQSSPSEEAVLCEGCGAVR